MRGFVAQTLQIARRTATGVQKRGRSCLLRALRALARLLNVRFLNIKHLGAIGHLAVELDCFAKEQALGIAVRCRGVLLAPADRVVNMPFLTYWEKHLRIIKAPWLCCVLEPLAEDESLRYDVSHYAMDVRGAAAFYRIQSAWGDRGPLIRVPENVRGRGLQGLRKLGLPRHAWFVCVHGRESGGRAQDPQHTHRNVDIETYIKAFEAITNRGGWCIRMGDPLMKPLPSGLRNVIDYAHHPLREPWLDMFLCASCRFFLGCNSGLNNVAVAFGVPCALTNVVPLAVSGARKCDLFIPKLIWSTRESRLLRFPEVFAFEAVKYPRASEYASAGLAVIDNSPEDIELLVVEMLDRLNKVYVDTPEDERLQVCYRNLFTPKHYAYGSEARPGTSFLWRFRHLLD